MFCPVFITNHRQSSGRVLPARFGDVRVGVAEVHDLLPGGGQVIHTRAAQVVEICNALDAERIHDGTTSH